MDGILSSIFPGIASMRNIHPLLVHFPIALLNAFLLMEVLGTIFKCDEMRSAATWMLYLGTLGALAAVAAGIQAYLTVPHPDEVHPIMERHKLYGIIVLVLAGLLSVWRLRARAIFSSRAWAVHLLIAVVMSGVMTFGADLGGLMVYGHGVGGTAVEVPAADADGHSHGSSHESSHEHSHADAHGH